MNQEIISTAPVDAVTPGLLLSGEDVPEEDPGAQSELRQLIVPAQLHDMRLDKALSQLVPEVSRSYLQQLVQDRAVQLAGKSVAKPAVKVKAGQSLVVELRPTAQAMAFVAQDMPLSVVYEDQDLLVIEKPAGLVVHPAAGNWTGTLLNGLLARYANATSLPRAGIVHRLDKDTSGLMLVGRSRQGVDALVAAIAAREVHRQYVALAQGEWKSDRELDVDRAIGRDPRNRLRMAAFGPEAGSGSKVARTSIERLDGNARATLVACKLHTGRTHQIRVHMAWLGFPLVGDALYGGSPVWGMNRQALHAARLGLRHPVTGEPLLFESSLPIDMVLAVKEAGLHYNGLPPLGP